MSALIASSRSGAHPDQQQRHQENAEEGKAHRRARDDKEGTALSETGLAGFEPAADLVETAGEHRTGQHEAGAQEARS